MILYGLLNHIREPAGTSDRAEFWSGGDPPRGRNGLVAGHWSTARLSKPVRDLTREVAGLDPDATANDSSLVESMHQGQPKLTRGIGRTFEVVRSVADHLHAGFPYVRTVKVGHDKDRFLGAQAEERGDRHKGVRDGPILNRRLEAAKVGKRFWMRQNSLRMAACLEGAAQSVEWPEGLHS